MSRAGLAWIREHYGVPAKRGMRVVVDGSPGLIVGSMGAHIAVRFNGEHFVRSCHPTWHVDYGDGIDHEAEHDARVADFIQAMEARG